MNRPGFLEKLSFFGGVLGSNLIIGGAGFILLYLTDVVGLGAAAVGTMLLVARIVDGALDPVLGYAVDHMPVTRWGRFRPYVLIGTVLTAVSLVVLFTAPAFLPGPLVWAWIAYLVFGAAVGLMSIPLVSLIPAVTDDGKARSQLAGIFGFTGLIAAAVTSGITLPLVKEMGGDADGWMVYAIVLAVFGLLTVWLMVARARERVVPLSPERYRLSDVRRVFFSGRAVPILLLCKVATNSASGALTAALPFFFRYYMRDEAMLSAAAVIMVIPMIAGAVGVPALARRGSSKLYYLASLGIAIVGFASIFVVPAQQAYVLACFAIIGVGFGGAVAMNLVLLAELTDYTEWRHGHRAEASLAAMVSFAAKAGSGVGAGVVAYTLALAHYRSGATTQTAEAVQGILVAQTLVPAGIALLGGIFFLAYPINRNVAAQAATALADQRTLALQQA